MGVAADQRRSLEGARNALSACSKDRDIEVADLKQIFTDYAAQLKQLGDTEIEKIKKTGRKEREKVKRKKSQERPHTDTKRKKGSPVQELKEDIIDFYKNKKSAIPIAPLIERKDVPLINFYVQPNLCRTFTNQYLITGKNQRKQQSDLCNQNVNIESPSKNPIKSYKELFLRDGKETHKRIYITAKAGYGKTSFAQSVCMTWCQAHSPDDEFRAKFKDRGKDLETMKGFELLFFISLKCTTEQDVDDMIHNQIISQLSRRLKYGREELENILNTEKHLIILDGLDEWSQKGAYQIGDSAAIRRIDRKTSTFLTTTRPWKMSDIKQSEIDIQIEIDQLDDESSDILLRNAVSVFPGETRDIVDFKEKFPSERLGVLRYIPYILLQLICLWYDKRHAGTSRSEIYSSAIELTFQRGLQKVKESITEKKTNSGKIPKRFCKFCPTLQDYFGLVLPLGRVAFYRYLSDKKEATFVFDKTDVVPRYMLENTLDDCLKVGILSQHDGEGFSCKRRKISFQHQTIQAFFAALYLQLDEDISDLKIFPSDMTEFSDVLLFLSGFNYLVAGRISYDLQNIVENYEVTRHYRKFTSMYMNYNYRGYIDTMKAFQDQIVSCAEESAGNGHEQISLCLKDIFIDKNCENTSYFGNKVPYLSALRVLTNYNKYDIKSLSIRECRSTEALTSTLGTLNLYNFENLEKLEIWAVPLANDLNFLLANSRATLRSLNLRLVLFEKKDHLKYSKDYVIKYKIVYPKNAAFGSDSIRAIADMKILQAISLDNLYITHDQLKQLMEYFQNSSDICEMELFSIHCTDHESKCNGVGMDISQLKKLDVLGIGDIPLSKIIVNCSNLKECWVGKLCEPVLSSLLESLQNEAVMSLETLYFRGLKPDAVKDVVSTHLKCNLKRIGYAFTRIIEVPFLCDTEMKNLEFLCLRKVEIESRTFEALVDVIEHFPKPVAITLRRCLIRPENDFEIIKSNILSSPERFMVSFNGRDVGGDRVFSFRPARK